MLEKYILILLLTLTVIYSTDLSNCKIKASHTGVLSSFRDSISNIQAGSVKLSSSLFGQNKRYIPFNITFNASIKNNYDLATSIQNIYSYVPSISRIDFQVSGIKRPSFFTGIFVIDSKAKWGWISLSYVVTTRNDFAAGNLIVNNDQLLATSSNNTQISFIMQVPTKSGLNTTYAYSVPFISGMITYDLALKLEFTDCEYISSNSRLNVTLFTRYTKFPLEFLSISYIIFNMASQIEITSLFNISFIPTNFNTYLGVSSIESTARTAQTTNTTTTVHFGLESTPAQIQVFNEMFGIDGVIIQTQQSIDLLYLPMAENSSTTLYCISKTSCQLYGGYMVYTQYLVFNISSRCQVCGRNMILNNMSGECECGSDYFLQNQSCISIASTCPANSTYNHTKQICECSRLFVNQSGKCIGIWQLCGSQQIYFGGKCIGVHFNLSFHSCPINYLNINNSCVQSKICSQSLLLNKSNNQCECPYPLHLVDGKCQACASNQTWLDKKCICKVKYFRINGACKQCGSNAFFDGNKCVCLRLFEGDGFKCTQTEKKKTSMPSLPGSLTVIGGSSGNNVN